MKMKLSYNKILPVLFGFFIMGFVDVVGISTSYVKHDFGLNDKVSNLLPMLVFVWFAVFSLPAGIAMRKRGRKNIVLLSFVITALGLLLPLISYNFPTVLVAFVLLGIGNTSLQVALNPLLTDVTSMGKLTSMLTLGQFIKAISSTLGPLIVGLASGVLGNWKLMFPIYTFLTLIAFVWLLSTEIKEEKQVTKNQSLGQIIGLLKDKHLLSFFIVIVLIVGFEVGLITTIPKYLLENFNIPLEQGGLACSLYYIARTLGTLLGTFLLLKYPIRKFFFYSMIAGVISLVGFIVLKDTVWLMISLFILGLACANVFAIAFSLALKRQPESKDEISALMILGVGGGALIPPIMGVLADGTNQRMSLIVPLLALIYIFYISIKMFMSNENDVDNTQQVMKSS